jgi:hypothetical protein
MPLLLLLLLLHQRQCVSAHTEPSSGQLKSLCYSTQCEHKLNILRQSDLGWPENGSLRTETCRFGVLTIINALYIELCLWRNKPLIVFVFACFWDWIFLILFFLYGRYGWSESEKLMWKIFPKNLQCVREKFSAGILKFMNHGTLKHLIYYFVFLWSP